METVRSVVPSRWTMLGVVALLLALLLHPTVRAVEVGAGAGKQLGTVALAKHTTSDHVREVLGRVFGRDDRSRSGSHSSSSSEDRSGNVGRWGRNRDNCRYHPYGGHHNPLYSSPYGQQALYNPYSNPSYSFGGLNGGYGGATGAFLGSGFGGGYPAGVQQQFGYGGFGQGAGAYPYSAGWNAVGQSPYGGYGSQLVGGGYYNRGGLYV
uniref:Uncharacterized protein n=1 Tax=Anopheles epiroticus TaxID=199890 RepID=A0A182PUP5_9DIPT